MIASGPPFTETILVISMVRKMKVKIADVEIGMCVNGGKQVLRTIQFADGTVLIAENECPTKTNKWIIVCANSEILKTNVDKSKVIESGGRNKRITVNCHHLCRCEWLSLCREQNVQMLYLLHNLR